MCSEDKLPLPREKHYVPLHGNIAYGTRTRNHPLCCAGTFLAYFLLQLEAFLCPHFSLRRWPDVQGRVGSQQHCCGVLCSSWAPSQPRHPNITVTFITE